MKTKLIRLMVALALLLPALVQAQVNYGIDTSDNTAYVTNSSGASGNVVIVSTYDGYPVTSIGEGAFFRCFGLTSVTIPNSVISIGGSAFFECYDLTNIDVATDNPAYSSVNGVLFDKSQTTLIQYPAGLPDASYAISNSVTSIGDGAFFASGLTSVTIPNSVTSIGDQAFQFCSGLTSVTIPNSVTSIGELAFYYCSGLTSVMIPNSVTSLGDQAFDGCFGLTNVTIPNSVTSIGDEAFSECYGLANAYFQGNAPTVDGVAGSADSTVFAGDTGTAYYVPGTTGWGSTFGGWPTAQWYQPQPQILGSGQGLGISSKGFNFTISWATNVSVVVEAATNLANPVWIPVSTNALVNGTNYFSDPQWTNYPMRFYRAAQAAGAFTVGGTVTGLSAWDSITLQDNGGDDLTLSTNGTFTFPTALPNGHAYSVTLYTTDGQVACTFTNGSGTISGANVTNVAVSCYDGCPSLTGNKDLDMYNAAVSDGTANGGVPGVMYTENGGPFRVTAEVQDGCSESVAEFYPGWAVFTHVVGNTSCSSTTFTNGTPVIQFGTVVECGFGPYGY